MALIKTKIPNFNGYRASVLFKNGVGTTNDTRLIEWFRTHGYTVETEVAPNPVVEDTPKELESLGVDELKTIAKNRGVFVGNTKDRDKLIAKLREVM
jgi:hypothetical protein